MLLSTVLGTELYAGSFVRGCDLRDSAGDLRLAERTLLDPLKGKGRKRIMPGRGGTHPMR